MGSNYKRPEMLKTLDFFLIPQALGNPFRFLSKEVE